VRAAAWLGALALLGAVPRVHAAPPSKVAEPSERGRLEGRVRAAGRRMPLADATLMIVAAPDDARPGRRAREPLDPDSVGWIREVQTDEQGKFAIDELPIGKVRVVVLASGYERTEVYAEVGGEVLELFVEPDERGGYRTEVISERPDERGTVEPEHRVDGEQARVYPGTGGDPVRVVQNLPGVARSPAGFGMIAIRGGDPRQTGIYLDGHPIRGAFTRCRSPRSWPRA
jgi:hypothetical protein